MAIRPYTSRELPGWGRLFGPIGSYKRDWFWMGARERRMRGKLHGYIMQLDIQKWTDRQTYFLGRWYDLPTQLFTASAVGVGDIVIDIGANRGDFALYAVRLVGATGRVVCFEPNPRVADILERDIATNGIRNVEVVRAGLGSERGELTLYVPNINSGQASFGKPDYSDQYAVRAPVLLGDEALYGVRPKLIKIDVEGFECHVIRGLEQTLREVRPIVLTEVNSEHLERCGSSQEELFSIMGRLGYKAKRLQEIRANDKGSYRLLDAPQTGEPFDAVWRNDGLN